MPQFSAYPAIGSLVAADLILVYQDSSGAVKTINADDAAVSLQALVPQVIEIDTESTNVVLDSTSKAVVANSAATLTFTLPDATASEGQQIYIYNRGSGTLTVQRAGADTINGDTSLELAQYQGLVFLSVGTGLWATLGTY